MDDSLTEFVKDEIRQSIATKRSLLDTPSVIAAIERAAHLLVEAFRNGRKLLIAGNGGSAADAQHLAAELVGRYKYERAGLPCFALTADTSVLTALSNDFTFDSVFARQIESAGREGDVFWAISTSGNSPNILAALEMGSKRKLQTIGFTGEGGRMAELCDVCIKIPAEHTARIQEAHILVGHIICSIVEESLFGADS